MSHKHLFVRFFPFRPTGLALLVLAAWLADLLFRWRRAVPAGHATPATMGVALICVLLFWLGNVLLLAGGSLLRPVPRPPRPLQ